MKSRFPLSPVTMVLVAISLVACATGEKPAAPAPVQGPDVPALAVRFDCGDCEVSATVAPLIIDTYGQAAASAGRRIDSRRRLELRITGYAERSLVWRFAAGPLAVARSDEIRAEIALGSGPMVIESSYRNPLRDIGNVARDVGRLSFEAAARAPH